MRKHQFAALLGGVLFVAGFALATGVDENMAQAVAVLILMCGALACFRYAERSVGSEASTDAHKRKAAKAA